jgi:hypothetical protein
MRVNRDDAVVCLRPAIGGHAHTTGRTLDYQHAARAADRSESKRFVINGMGGVYAGRTIYSLTKADRVSPCLVRGRELRKKK